MSFKPKPSQPDLESTNIFPHNSKHSRMSDTKLLSLQPSPAHTGGLSVTEYSVAPEDTHFHCNIRYIFPHSVLA